MKKLLMLLQICICALVISACSDNPSKSPHIPASPKPATYPDTIAVAAKKADFYVRLAFDLADGYLSDTSVVRKRYGKDGKYVESLEFGRADIDGSILTTNISAPLFKYWRYDTSVIPVPEVVVSSGINAPGLSTKNAKRTFFIGNVTGATYGSFKTDITFRGTDATSAKSEQIALSVDFAQKGFLTSQGASMNITTPFTIWVQDSSGVYHNFNISINNVAGAIKVVGANYKPKASDEFSMNSGTIIVTGTDTSSNPHATYTITLQYANDKVEGKTGNFTASNGFSANYTIDKDLAYYTKGSDTSRKYYAYWDYPL